jgi:radical SAM family RiPP maturation amino acid epimerase
MNTVPHTKRFLERWIADLKFREKYRVDPGGAIREYQLQVDAEHMRHLIDEAFAKIPVSDIPPEVSAYRQFIREKLAYRENIRVRSASHNKIFRAWRERQMKRSLWELGPSRFAGLVHAPFCIELSKGCTVGCWFCGVGAEGFQGNFLYTPDAGTLWRSVLEVLQEVLGDAAACGFCYWATDPLDNPDYERFILDFRRVLGTLPQTTTALAMRDPERTHSLLQLSRNNGGVVERFSVLSLGIFDRILREFSAEELLSVELIPQFQDKASPKVIAGKGREHRNRVLRQNESLDQPQTFEDGGTIACVTGFLLNMVDRSIALISPCTASEKWPLGYIVFGRWHFRDAASLRDILRVVTSEHMPASLKAHDEVRLQPSLSVRRGDGSFRLANRFFNLDFSSLLEPEHLADAVESGSHTVAEIADARHEKWGIPHLWTHRELSVLLNEGVLCDPLVTQLAREPLVAIAGAGM